MKKKLNGYTTAEFNGWVTYTAFAVAVMSGFTVAMHAPLYAEIGTPFIMAVIIALIVYGSKDRA